MEGHSTHEQTRALTALLDAFGGDELAARAALQAYAHSQRVVAVSAEPKVPTGPVLLSVKDLHKTYKVGKQKLEVLKGVTLDVHQGELVAITGASGSGKSTLLQLMGGLDKPTAGEVCFGDKSLASFSDSQLSVFRRQTVGFVFQFFYLQPFLKLSKNLEVPGMFASMPKQVRQARTNELAGKVGLGNRLNHLPKELSGGQMQRAAIARALYNNPKIILADEPTGNLDSENGRAIIELFETIRKEFGTTVVIVTHDAAIAARADREICLKDGEVV